MLWKGSRLAPELWTALFLLLFVNHLTEATRTTVTQETPTTGRTILQRISPDDEDFASPNQSNVKATQTLLNIESTIPRDQIERTTADPSEPSAADEVSTIVTIDVSKTHQTAETPNSPTPETTDTAATRKHQPPEYASSKFTGTHSEGKTASFQEIVDEKAITQPEAISLSGDTNVNNNLRKDAKRKPDKNLGSKNANTLENEDEVEDGNYGPKNEVEIVPVTATTNHPPSLKITRLNKADVKDDNEKEANPTSHGRTIDLSPSNPNNWTTFADKTVEESKPYPYSKIQQISKTTTTSGQSRTVSTTEESSAYENTIGRRKLENSKLHAVTEAGFDKSASKLKVSHQKLSSSLEPITSTSTESLSSYNSLETNDVTLNVTTIATIILPRNVEGKSSVKFSEETNSSFSTKSLNSSTVNSVVRNGLSKASEEVNSSASSSSAEASTKKTTFVTLTSPSEPVSSRDVLVREQSQTVSLADINTSDDKLALESFEKTQPTPSNVEYEFVGLTDFTTIKESSTTGDAEVIHLDEQVSNAEMTSAASKQTIEQTTVTFSGEDTITQSSVASETNEEFTTTPVTTTLDKDDTSKDITDSPGLVTTEPMTPMTMSSIASSNSENKSSTESQSTNTVHEGTELPTLQSTTIPTVLTTSVLMSTTTTTMAMTTTTIGSTDDEIEGRIASDEITQPSIIFTTISSTNVIVPPTLPRVKIDIDAPVGEVCAKLQILREDLAKLLMTNADTNVSFERVMFDPNQCSETVISSADITLTTLLVYIVDENGSLDENLTEMLADMYKQNPNTSFRLPIRSFILVTLPKADSGNAIAVVAVSCVAFICLVLLAGLLFIMRKRQTRFNYGERCRPVSLDAYSLDSVSAYNSVRRKGAARSSKRSYGNPTFEDASAIPSHPLNFAGLSTFCEDLNTIGEEFSAIPQVSAKIDELPPGAEVKNRYANVIPLPETRVPLSRLNDDPLTEYINASYVRGPKNAMKYYIACQAPTETTVVDFWRMIWEQQSKVIIMLTDLVENGVEKCTEYIPPSEVTDCHRLFGDFQITLKKRETKEKYAISTLILKNLENNTFREVYHIWYLWPASGVPSDAAAVIAILLEARALQRGGPEPLVIHCSPGTGRTGTLISLDLGIRQYEITRTVDVPRVVYTIRRDRAGAVQTKEQYAFVYKALNLYATKLTGGALDST